MIKDENIGENDDDKIKFEYVGSLENLSLDSIKPTIASVVLSGCEAGWGRVIRRYRYNDALTMNVCRYSFICCV